MPPTAAELIRYALSTIAMSLIAQDILIEAKPDAIFKALTLQEGLSSWWTSDTTTQPIVGSVAEFGFYQRSIVTRFRIEELEQARRIRWHCLAGPQEYLGSEVVFELEATASGTILHFAHRQLKGTDDFMRHADQSWHRVLASLKSYVETGQGRPISM